MRRSTKGPFIGYPISVVEKFLAYHKANPGVYKLFKQYAIDMRATGRKQYSAEIIINMIRWHHDITTKGDVFKITNDFKPLYSRLLVHYHPEFQDFFQFRTVRSMGIASEEERARLAST